MPVFKATAPQPAFTLPAQAHPGGLGHPFAQQGPHHATHEALTQMAHQSPRQQHFAQTAQMAQAPLDASGQANPVAQAALEPDGSFDLLDLGTHPVPLFIDDENLPGTQALCVVNTPQNPAIFCQYSDTLNEVFQMMDNIASSTHSSLGGGLGAIMADSLTRTFSAEIRFYRLNANNELVVHNVSKDNTGIKKRITWLYNLYNSDNPGAAGNAILRSGNASRLPHPRGTATVRAAKYTKDWIEHRFNQKHDDMANINHNVDTTIGAKIRYQSTVPANPSATRPVIMGGVTRGYVTAAGAFADPFPHDPATVSALKTHLQGMDHPTTPWVVKGNTMLSRPRGQGQMHAMGGWNALGAAVFAKYHLGTELANVTPGTLPTNQHWEWLHLQGAQIGGATHHSNLVAGLYSTNSAMIPYENKIKELGANMRDDFLVKFGPGNQNWGPFTNSIIIEAFEKVEDDEMVAPEDLDMDEEMWNEDDVPREEFSDIEDDDSGERYALKGRLRFDPLRGPVVDKLTDAINRKENNNSYFW